MTGVQTMRWPYNARVDPAHAWGTVGSGIAILGVIVGALASLHGGASHFRWWWPTNWMIVPVVVVLIGLAMVVAPLRRHKGPANNQGDESGKSPQQPQAPQTSTQYVIADGAGSIAQGAIHGNVINYGKPTSAEAADPDAAEPSEKRP